jgi:hypothetical protein
MSGGNAGDFFGLRCLPVFFARAGYGLQNFYFHLAFRLRQNGGEFGSD